MIEDGHVGAIGAADRITFTGLRARGYHGVYEFERVQGQDFVVDVALELDLRPAIASDDVADTVNYGELAERLVAIVGGPPVNLIETLAARLVEACLADARVAAATVTVHKPHAPIAHEFADISVTLRRIRKAHPARADQASADHEPTDHQSTGQETKIMIGGAARPQPHDHDDRGSPQQADAGGDTGRKVPS